MRQIAEAIGRHLDIPAVSIEAEEADEYLSFLSFFIQLHNPTSSAKTQQLLGWKPTRPGLIAEMERATTSPTPPPPRAPTAS